LPESLRLAERRTWLLGALLAVALTTALGLAFAIWKGTGSEAVTTALNPPPSTPTVAPVDPAPSGLENSASKEENARGEQVQKDALTPAASAAWGARLPPPVSKKPAAKGKGQAPLERRGNERYGRFE
jgi:hypothetical protein